MVYLKKFEYKLLVRFLCLVIVRVITAADSLSSPAAIKLIIKPDQYIDSDVWLHHARQSPKLFPPMIIDLSNMPYISKCITLGLENEKVDASKGGNQPVFHYIHMIRQYVMLARPNYSSEFILHDIGFFDQKIDLTQFVCMVIGIQLSKYCNRLELLCGNYIVAHCEKKPLNALFCRVKQDQWQGMQSPLVSKQIECRSQQLLGREYAKLLCVSINRFDKMIENMEDSKTAIVEINKLFHSHLSSIDVLLMRKFWSKL